jgi:hypothetical protein
MKGGEVLELAVGANASKGATADPRNADLD